MEKCLVTVHLPQSNSLSRADPWLSLVAGTWQHLEGREGIIADGTYLVIDSLTTQSVTNHCPLLVTIEQITIQIDKLNNE